MTIHPDIQAVLSGERRWCVVTGDCLEVLPTLPAKSVDTVVTDPPYGMTDCEWDRAGFDIDGWWSVVDHVAAKDAAIIATASQPFTSVMVMSRRDWFHSEWIWRKNAGSNFGTVKWHPMKEHESVLVFTRGRPVYNPIRQPRKRPIKAGYVNRSNTGKRHFVAASASLQNNRGFEVTDGEFRCPSSVQDFNRERGHHPTQKPTALMAYMVRTYSNADAIILDPFTGSGTTGVAAIKTGRRFIGIEIDDKYAEIARGRIAAAEAEVSGGISWNSSKESGDAPSSTARPTTSTRRS